MKKSIENRFYDEFGLRSMTKEIMAGTVQRYDVWIYFSNWYKYRNPHVIIRIGAKQGGVSALFPFGTFAEELRRESHGGIKRMERDHSGITIVMERKGLDSAMIKQVTWVLDSILDYLEKYQYIPCCECCGSTEGRRTFAGISKKDFSCCCPECLHKYMEKKEELQKKLVTEYPLGAVFGALIGMFLCFVFAKVSGGPIEICTFDESRLLYTLSWIPQMAIPVGLIYGGYYFAGKGLNIPGLFICGVLLFLYIFKVDNVYTEFYMGITGFIGAQILVLAEYFQQRKNMTCKIYD